MRLYGLKTCDTCRAARRALAAAGREPDEVDVRGDGVPEADLRRFLDAFGEALINRRSTTWRGLSEAERAGDPLTLLTAHPTLMKRPVIEADGRLYLGWGKDVQDKLLG
ncbi:ArsC/Spx/MgsR family protein [Actibacterium sp. MT2.3-13A]|uniref:ArsC/Spx/MgsR family protein n=1 Tax=Actibacterium sp. MT2.3-13A TaxID=2828332 RepID=UPI001BA8E246|nr:ArsC/Spx/MgsR family protein [Actibacterium sp. MT2.3-13A]